MKKIYTLLLFFFIIFRVQAQPPVSLINMVNPTCTNDTDGVATFSINGFDFPYSATLTGCNTLTLGGIMTNTFTMTGLQNCLFYTNPSPSGNYNLVLYDNMNNAAGFISFSVTTVYPFFLLQMNSFQNITCPGMNNGSTGWITVYGTGPFSFLWSTSTNPNYATTQNINNLSPGYYSITATDSYGCKLTYGVSVFDPYFSNTIGNASAPTCCNGNISPYIVGIMPASSVNYSFTPSISNLSAVCAGNYTLTVNSPSCTMSTALSVGCLTGIDELQKGSVRIYPNPAISHLKIELPEGYEAEELVVTNYLGQEVMHSPFKNQIDMSGLAQGSYLLTIKFLSGTNYHTKFIKE